MKIAIIGAGHIGGNLAGQLANKGYDVTVSFSRDEQTLQDLAQGINHNVQVASPQDAVSDADIIVLSVPWDAIDSAVAQMGNVNGKIIIDTTNPFGRTPINLEGLTSRAYNQKRLPGARVAKAFNTITANYQAEVATGQHQPIAMFYAAPDLESTKICEELIAATGFTPVALEGQAETLLEAPRRKGAVYGESYSPSDAEKIATTARQDLARAAELASSLRQQ